MLQNPFDAIAREYGQWFDDNPHTFHSELEVVRFFFPAPPNSTTLRISTGKYTTPKEAEKAADIIADAALWLRETD